MFDVPGKAADEEVVGELQLIHIPAEFGPGIYEDVEGVRWDVRQVRWPHVWARQLARSTEVYSRAGSVDKPRGVGLKMPNPIHEWLPYRVEGSGGR